MATCFVTMALIYHGSYRRIEWLTTVIVVSVTLITVTAAVALGWTDYPVRASDVARGSRFQVPSDGLWTAFAVFGITGVGATELFYYPYWCLEKGYARFTGRTDPAHGVGAAGPRVDPRDASRRLGQHGRVHDLDGRLLPDGSGGAPSAGAAPKGAELIDTLSKMFIGPFGAWTRTLFLIGAARSCSRRSTCRARETVGSPPTS